MTLNYVTSVQKKGKQGNPENISSEHLFLKENKNKINSGLNDSK